MTGYQGSTGGGGWPAAADEILIKPFMLSELLDMLRGVIAPQST
jgi:DNA-binding response OmpR family regulator